MREPAIPVTFINAYADALVDYANQYDKDSIVGRIILARSNHIRDLITTWHRSQDEIVK